MRPFPWSLSSLAVLALTLATVPAKAQTASGNSMLQYCRDALSLNPSQRDAVSHGVCFGAVRSVMELKEFVDPKYRFCTPAEVTTGQATRVVIRFMEANPKIHHWSLGSLTLAALGEAYPCPREGRAETGARHAVKSVGRGARAPKRPLVGGESRATRSPGRGLYPDTFEAAERSKASAF